jgi:hypothetical protein
MYSLFFADDLDLAVITPQYDLIYYDNLFDTTTGGFLDGDTSPCGCCGCAKGNYVENIAFHFGAPPGVYGFGVIEAVPFGSLDKWTIRVYVSGKVVMTKTGKGASDPFTYLMS